MKLPEYVMEEVKEFPKEERVSKSFCKWLKQFLLPSGKIMGLL